jgi:hypothetical protein
MFMMRFGKKASILTRLTLALKIRVLNPDLSSGREISVDNETPQQQSLTLLVFLGGNLTRDLRSVLYSIRWTFSSASG